jgi:hypothetical protein
MGMARDACAFISNFGRELTAQVHRYIKTDIAMVARPPEDQAEKTLRLPYLVSRRAVIIRMRAFTPSGP